MGKLTDWKKINDMGPYGMKCICCGPAPGKVRKAAKRRWKHAERRIIRKQIDREIAT